MFWVNVSVSHSHEVLNASLQASVTCARRWRLPSGVVQGYMALLGDLAGPAPMGGVSWPWLLGLGPCRRMFSC